MAYRLEFAKRVQKDIKKLDSKTKIRIYACFSNLARNPFIGKKLQGDLKNQYSVRVWPYRIIYEIYQSTLLILVVKIAHRKDVYR